MAALALAGCHQSRVPPAAAYQHWKDRVIVGLGLPVLGIWPFPPRKEIELGTPVYVGQPTDRCFRMEQQKRWTGLWRNEFEGSRLCPAPATECSLATPGDDIWLNAERATKKEPDGALYAVELIGRRTAVKAYYGHLGGSNLELIVDRFISVKKVGPPKTAVEQQGEFERCKRHLQCRSWDK